MLNSSGATIYRSFWAFTERDERPTVNFSPKPFESVIDIISASWQTHETMHVYRSAPYEPSAFKRLMERYATRERELDKLLRAGRFVDLYRRCSAGRPRRR